MLKSILIALLLMFAMQHNEVIADNKSCESSSECAYVEQWDISVALGYGQKSNPLQDYDDIPLYILPSIAYYGEKWFFDNGNIGYSLKEAETFSINISTSYSEDRAYFYDWDPSNLFLGNTSANSDSILQMPMKSKGVIDQPKVFNELESRRFTLFGGVEGFYYLPWGFLKAAYGHDMFNVHNGDIAHFSWNYGYAINQWVFDFTLKTDWKSAKVIQYYYGVRQSENEYWSQQYKASSGWDSGVELTTRYIINQHWDALLALRYNMFSDAIKNSPLVNENNSKGYFIGMAYRF
ncbi:MipA/OmpV family protein [Shewanella gaetbuli]